MEQNLDVRGGGPFTPEMAAAAAAAAAAGGRPWWTGRPGWTRWWWPRRPAWWKSPDGAGGGRAVAGVLP